MRLPRFRCSLGTFLFAVAVVAVNGWGFLRFYEVPVFRCCGVMYRVLPAGIGVLPLVNVALIGISLFAARRIRSLLLGNVASSRSSLSGITYFSCHILILYCLSSFFTPDDIYEYMNFSEISTAYAASGWKAIFGQPEQTISWIVFQSFLLCLFISGPPLILSWIGHLLAKRSAATLSRRRFHAMTCLVSLGFASAGLAICLTPQVFTNEQKIVLDFQVFDEESGRPITAAFIRITSPFSLDPAPVLPSAFTDTDGRARLSDRFESSGERNAFQSWAVFSPWGRWLEVSAADHRKRRVPLTEVVGFLADPARPSLRRVYLARGETREDSFRDLAGFYLAGGHGFGGRWFKIEPDGRFAFSEWGCVPPDSQECGYLERYNGEIDLVLIPHPGREINPLVTVKYQAIEWGDCLFLSSADEHELREFCRAALTPSRPSKSEDTYGPFLRQSDRDKSQAGLPRLPLKVWMNFLIDEMNLKDETSSLRLALASILPKTPQEE